MEEELAVRPANPTHRNLFLNGVATAKLITTVYFLSPMNVHKRIEQDDKFLSFLKRTSSNGTQRLDKRAMRFYLQFLESAKGIELMPGDLLKRYDDDRSKEISNRGHPEEEWIEFVHWLQNSKKHDLRGNLTDDYLSPASVRSCGGSIKSFYSWHGMTLSRKAQAPRIVRRATPKLENMKFEYRPENVKKLLAVMKNNRDKAITLVMFQSGMDISTALSLTWGQVRRAVENDEAPLLVHVTRQKTGLMYRTLLGKDAIDAIKTYVRERTMTRYVCDECGRSSGDKRNICPECRSEVMKPFKETLESDTPLFNPKNDMGTMLNPSYQRVLRRCAVLANLVTVEEMQKADINPARPHALRSAFESILSLHGANQGLIDSLMGHETQYGGAYKSASNDELRQMYSKYEKHLSVNDSQDFQDVREEFSERIRSLDQELQDMKAKMEIFEAVLLDPEARKTFMDLQGSSERKS